MSRPWITLASEATAEGALELRQRGEDYLITIAGRILMSSRTHRSEDDLAQLACAELVDRPRARVLVSGLGLGFTLRAALDALGPAAHVTVAELNPIVVAWCRGPLTALNASAALDPRVHIEVQDVAATIAHAGRRPETRFDAIILDMYEGPHHTVKPADPLYGPAAVARVRSALQPGGIFAVWGESESAGFEQSLRQAGFRHRRVRAGHGGSIYTIYLAK